MSKDNQLRGTAESENPPEGKGHPDISEWIIGYPSYGSMGVLLMEQDEKILQ